jgi:ABC-type antimicrobial peptide transport system permease subunit
VRTVATVWRAAVLRAAPDVLIVQSASPSMTELPVVYVDDIKEHVEEAARVTPRWSLDVSEPGLRARRTNVIAVDAPQIEATLTGLQPGAAAKMASDTQLVAASTAMTNRLHWPVGQAVRLRAANGAMVDATLAGTFVAEDNAAQILAVRPEVLHTLAIESNVHDIEVRMKTPALSAMTARSIDKLFAERRRPTQTDSEQRLAADNASKLGGLFRLIDRISFVLLFALAIVVGNTVALSSGERTTQYAVLRALGFTPQHVGMVVAAEALLTTLLGAIVGTIVVVLLAELLPLAAPPDIVNLHVTLSPITLLIAAVAAITLGLLASLFPAWRATEIAVSEELRRQG